MMGCFGCCSGGREPPRLADDDEEGGRSSSSSSSSVVVVCSPSPRRLVPVPHDQLLPYIRRFGSHVLAQSTLQPGMLHFLVPGVGFLAYGFRNVGPPFLRLRSPVVLGDPVCSPSDREHLARLFLQRWPDAMFLQVTRDMALVLQGLGMFANAMGGETHLDACAYDFSGAGKRGLRSAISGALRSGVCVEVVPVITPAVAADMQAVHAAWLAARPPGAGRLWFLNRPPAFAPEDGVLLLAAYDASGVMQAFIAFDPLWEEGEVTGFYANVTRMRPDAHSGVLNLIIKTFLEHVRTEPPRKLRAAPAAAPAAPGPDHAAAAATPRGAGDAPPPATPAAAAGGEEVLSAFITLRGPGAAAGSPEPPPAAPAAWPSPGPSPQRSAGSSASGDLGAPPSPADSATSMGGGGGGGGGGAPKAASPPTPCSGVRVLSLGLSPLHALQDDLRHSAIMSAWLRRAYEHGDAFYPFKTLAASKAKYGAGMAGAAYKDHAVEWRPAYICHRHHVGAAVPLFDVFMWLGFTGNPLQGGAVLLRHKLRQAAQEMRAKRAAAAAAAEAARGGAAAGRRP